MLHVKPSAQTPTAAPHCGSHCHPAPRSFNTASSVLLQALTSAQSQAEMGSLRKQVDVFQANVGAIEAQLEAAITDRQTMLQLIEGPSPRILPRVKKPHAAR